MRTKEEITRILANKHVSTMLQDSNWGDLVNAISSFDAQQKDNFVKLIASGQDKKVGQTLHKALLKDAQDRAKSYVGSMLADDNLSLTELDGLI